MLSFFCHFVTGARNTWTVHFFHNHVFRERRERETANPKEINEQPANQPKKKGNNIMVETSSHIDLPYLNSLPLR